MFLSVENTEIFQKEDTLFNIEKFSLEVIVKIFSFMRTKDIINGTIFVSKYFYDAYSLSKNVFFEKIDNVLYKNISRDFIINNSSIIKKINIDYPSKINYCGDFEEIRKISEKYDAFSKIENLQILRIPGTHFCGRFLCKLTGLTKLDLSCTGVNVLMGDLSLKDLTNLTFLSLAGTYSGISDNSISLLTNLKSFHISYSDNLITENSITKLTNLYALSFNNTSKKINCNSLTKLEYLFCNKIAKNEYISNLTNLERLHIQYSNIFINDNGISMLTNLKSLSLGRRYYSTSVSKLNKLEFIIANKKLKQDFIKDLDNLKFIKVPIMQKPNISIAFMEELGYSWEYSTSAKYIIYRKK